MYPEIAVGKHDRWLMTVSYEHVAGAFLAASLGLVGPGPLNPAAFVMDAAERYIAGQVQRAEAHDTTQPHDPGS